MATVGNFRVYRTFNVPYEQLDNWCALNCVAEFLCLFPAYELKMFGFIIQASMRNLALFREAPWQGVGARAGRARKRRRPR